MYLVEALGIARTQVSLLFDIAFNEGCEFEKLVNTSQKYEVKKYTLIYSLLIQSPGVCRQPDAGTDFLKALKSFFHYDFLHETSEHVPVSSSRNTALAHVCFVNSNSVQLLNDYYTFSKRKQEFFQSVVSIADSYKSYRSSEREIIRKDRHVTSV